jgi:hypothetical protein
VRAGDEKREEGRGKERSEDESRFEWCWGEARISKQFPHKIILLMKYKGLLLSCCCNL